MAASSPRDVELHFQQIQNIVDAPVSARWALRQVAQFLAQLDLDRPGVESYLLPLVEPIATRADDLDPVGLYPDTIADLAGRLQRARRHHPALAEMEQLEEAEGALRRRAALLYAYAGAIDRAVDCLHPEADSESTVEELAASTPRERFQAVRTEDRSSGLDRAFRWIAAHWDQADDGEHVSFVPVVEQSPAWMNGGNWAAGSVGALHRIGVELYGPSDTTDRLQVDMVAHGADEADLAAVPLRAARRLLEDRHPRLRGRYVQGRLAFDHSHLQHQGQSAGLAVAALFYGAVLDHTRRRCRRRLRSQLAVSGSIAADGTVRSVDGDTLPVKVRTAFFSPKTTLVVPEAQQSVAEDVRASLLEDYPHGELSVVGGDRLEALFFDRRLTEEEHIGWTRHLGRRVWDRRERVVMGALIAVLLLMVGILWYGPVDKNPVQARYSGETMFVQNANGRTIERIDVGRRTVQKKVEGRPADLVEFEDVTGDGRNEIIWAEWRDPRTNTPGQIHCMSVGADTTRWTIPLRFENPFYQEEIKGMQFQPVDLHAGDLDADSEKEVYAALRHQTYFPSYLMKFDAATGAEQARYVHPGHLRHAPFEVADLDEDAAKELLVGAHSNAFGDAVLIVLDSRRIQGHAPVQGSYAVRGLSPARHEAYIRFPTTKVDTASQLLHPFVREVEVNARTGRFTAQVQDGQVEEEAGRRRSYVLVTFTSDFEPVSVGTSSWYDRLAQRLVQEGRLDAVPGPADFRRYREQIRYWTGGGWGRRVSKDNEHHDQTP